MKKSHLNFLAWSLIFFSFIFLIFFKDQALTFGSTGSMFIVVGMAGTSEGARKALETKRRNGTDKSPRKGLTFEEYFGKEKAEKVKNNMRRPHIVLHPRGNFTPEHHINLGLSHKKLWTNYTPEEYEERCKKMAREGEPWNKGLTTETDERVRKYGEKVSEARTGKYYPKLSEAKVKWWASLTPEKYLWFCNLLQSPRKGFTFDEYYGVEKSMRIRNQISKSTSESRTGKHYPRLSEAKVKYWAELTPEKYKLHCQNLSEARKMWWISLTPEQKEVYVRKGILGRLIRPNKPEQKLIQICKDYNLPFQYYGNKVYPGLGGKMPDFVYEEEKKIVEFYGDYIHQGQNPQDRIDYFKQFGYNTLILWEHDTINSTDEEIANLIQNFMSFAVQII